MGTDASPMTTLWDLIARPERQRPAAPKRQPAPKPARPRDRYAQLVEAMKREHGVRIHRWRSSMSGCAWQVRYRDGTVSKLIQSPQPRGPMSAAVFLHEVGHHAIGFNRYKPRCLEEHMAWQWALAAMEQHGITITPRVRQRVHRSMQYAVAKAMRRGLKRLPVELMVYLPSEVQARLDHHPDRHC